MVQGGLGASLQPLRQPPQDAAAAAPVFRAQGVPSCPVLVPAKVNHGASAGAWLIAGIDSYTSAVLRSRAGHQELSLQLGRRAPEGMVTARCN